MHLNDETLKKLVDGRLPESEMEQVITHLESCEACVDKVDEFWRAEPLAAAVSRTPDLDPETARRVERKLVHQIHRSDLVGDIIRLLFQGFGGVAGALVRPLIDRRPLTEKGESYD